MNATAGRRLYWIGVGLVVAGVLSILAPLFTAVFSGSAILALGKGIAAA